MRELNDLKQNQADSALIRKEYSALTAGRVSEVTYYFSLAKSNIVPDYPHQSAMIRGRLICDK